MSDESRPYADCRALVADDDKVVRLIVRRFLEKCGFGVEVAADGAEALDTLRLHPCDLVISDMRMPGMGGIEFLKRARERGLTSPVILLTAASSAPDAVEATAFGAFACLEKPVKLERLLEVIDAAMAQSRVQAGKSV